MQYWLLKTEPDDYAFADLAREQRCVWDGVKNNWALQHLRAMQRGDLAFVYHTGKERRIVGLAEVVRAAYPDPALEDPKRLVVDLRARIAVPRPVPLADIKCDARFAEFLLVRSSRLSVVPVSPAHWRALCMMGEIDAKSLS
jgi:predicted RNA-binding protein with PUA-like domain